MQAEQQEKETTDTVALLGIKGNLKSKRRNIGKRQETRRWLREFKGGCREAREKPNTLQGKADAEDESSQLAKMMESQTTPQAGPINYGLKRHFLP